MRMMCRRHRAPRLGNRNGGEIKWAAHTITMCQLVRRRRRSQPRQKVVSISSRRRESFLRGKRTKRTGVPSFLRTTTAAAAAGVCNREMIDHHNVAHKTPSFNAREQAEPSLNSTDPRPPVGLVAWFTYLCACWMLCRFFFSTFMFCVCVFFLLLP